MQQSIVKFLLPRRTDTAQHVSGITMPIIRSPQTAVAASGFRMNVEVEVFSAVSRLRTLPLPHSYGNQRLQRQFDGLLMMGIVMPETC